MAQKLGTFECVEVLQIGDHDRSGTHIFSSLGEDVQAFARGWGVKVPVNREPGELRYPPPRIHTEEAFDRDIYEYQKPSFRLAAKACIRFVRSGFFTGMRQPRIS